MNGEFWFATFPTLVLHVLSIGFASRDRPTAVGQPTSWQATIPLYSFGLGFCCFTILVWDLSGSQFWLQLGRYEVIALKAVKAEPQNKRT